MSGAIPCVLFEDGHVLVVNKPAGLNTHAPAPYAGEGIYDWLRHREPRWASLAIVHRLDKDTSGVMVFPKSPLANRSLTQQFTARAVRKRYLLLSTAGPSEAESTIRSRIVRMGERYASRPAAGTDVAETRFRAVATDVGRRVLVEAEPLTGRTHQIRVHAAALGFPVLGDALYGGKPYPRLCLHAAELGFNHPATGQPVAFTAEPRFEEDIRIALREALIDLNTTNCFRLAHGNSDHDPGVYVDRFGEFLVASAEHGHGLPETVLDRLRQDACRYALRGAYTRRLTRQPGKAPASDASPQILFGEAAPDEITVLENGLRYALHFEEGYSVGLFLDQRDNRRRLLTGHVGMGIPVFPPESTERRLLNVFAYTCAFSVAAAAGGAVTTSLDLSRKYLEWGQRNFRLNGLDPAGHDFIYGDAFDWLRRLSRKGRQFEAMVLDPPTFSRSKQHGTFQAEKDYGALLTAALPLLVRKGILLASTNAALFKPEQFLDTLSAAVSAAGRAVTQQHYVPQPPDFPISPEEPAYLKTVWLRIS